MRGLAVHLALNILSNKTELVFLNKICAIIKRAKQVSKNVPNGRHLLCNKSIVVYIKFQNIQSTLYLQCTDTGIEHGIVIVLQILVGRCNSVRKRTLARIATVTHTECCTANSNILYVALLCFNIHQLWFSRCSHQR